MLFATSLADCTKCLLATGFAVFDEAMRQALHKAEVCLATIVAADNTCKNRWHKTSRLSKEHDSYYTPALQSRSSKPCNSFKPKLLCLVTKKAQSSVLTMTISLQSSGITCDGLLAGSTKFWQAIWIAWLALANWIGSTRPCWPAWLFGSEMPTR